MKDISDIINAFGDCRLSGWLFLLAPGSAYTGNGRRTMTGTISFTDIDTLIDYAELIELKEDRKND